MIKNDKQLSVSRARLRQLEEAIECATSPSDIEVYSALADEARYEISEYLLVTDGTKRAFRIESVDDLADAVISARLSRGWTQKQVADALGVSEQMVQRDEAGAYARAGVGRIADVIEVLEYELTGELRPAEQQQSDRVELASMEIGAPTGLVATAGANIARAMWPHVEISFCTRSLTVSQAGFGGFNHLRDDLEMTPFVQRALPESDDEGVSLLRRLEMELDNNPTQVGG